MPISETSNFTSKLLEALDQLNINNAEACGDFLANLASNFEEYIKYLAIKKEREANEINADHIIDEMLNELTSQNNTLNFYQKHITKLNNVVNAVRNYYPTWKFELNETGYYITTMQVVLSAACEKDNIPTENLSTQTRSLPPEAPHHNTASSNLQKTSSNENDEKIPRPIAKAIKLEKHLTSNEKPYRIPAPVIPVATSNNKENKKEASWGKYILGGICWLLGFIAIPFFAITGTRNKLWQIGDKLMSGESLPSINRDEPIATIGRKALSTLSRCADVNKTSPESSPPSGSSSLFKTGAAADTKSPLPAIGLHPPTRKPHDPEIQPIQSPRPR